MVKKIFKPFFSKVKERKWLDSLGEKGYLLKDINDSSYYFEICDGKKFCYCIENLSVSPFSDTANKYFGSRKDEGITPVFAKGNWVYSVSETEPLDVPEKVTKSMAGIYKTRCIYLYFFSAVIAFVCGFQLYAVNYLESVGYISKDISLITIANTANAGFFEAFKNIFRRIGNFFINLANGYFGIWTDIFGNSDAIKVFSVLLPILIALLIIAAFNLDEYFKYKNMNKDQKKDTENNIQVSSEAENAKQEI